MHVDSKGKTKTMRRTTKPGPDAPGPISNVNLRLSWELWREVRQQVFDEGTTAVRFVEEALRDLLEKRKGEVK